MTLDTRIRLLVKLGQYITQNTEEWQAAKEKAERENGWFTQDFINLAAENIVRYFLQEEALQKWAAEYELPAQNNAPKTVGLVMAGNIPLVGFHDFLSIFISGHRQLIKPSSKDSTLIKHLVEKLQQWDAETASRVGFAEMLKGCDAYIATGSNNSSRYFEYYFRNTPSIIRKNRTSAAILTGLESPEELNLLADDMMLYFGLGCRNISKLYVPNGYDFMPLLAALKRYDWMADHHKFKNNYDYNLSLLILNHQYYMSTPALLLVESEQLFSAIARVNYSFYETIPTDLEARYPDELQCVSGKGFTDFGLAQQPALTNYADGVDTLKWLGEM